MLVSPVHLLALAHTLEIEGMDARAALQRCGIESIETLSEEGAWVEAALFDRLMAAAIELSGDPAFGLVAGKSIALMRYGPFVPLVLPSPSLRQILADLRHFARLVLDHAEIELAEAPASARLIIRPVVHGGASGHFRMEMVATSALQMLRLAGASPTDVHRIEMPYTPASEMLRRYAAAFGPHLRFGSHECALHINPALLDAKMAMHDPVAYTAARTRAESALAARLAQSNVAERVRLWLLGRLAQPTSTADTAQHLGLSERSLRRQLAALGVTHASLLDECQRLMAERLLAEGQSSIQQVADSLGFSSASSFHRAFRRWTGQTPAGWREQQAEASPKAI